MASEWAVMVPITRDSSCWRKLGVQRGHIKAFQAEDKRLPAACSSNGQAPKKSQQRVPL